MSQSTVDYCHLVNINKVLLASTYWWVAPPSRVGQGCRAWHHWQGARPIADQSMDQPTFSGLSLAEMWAGLLDQWTIGHDQGVVFVNCVVYSICLFVNSVTGNGFSCHSEIFRINELGVWLSLNLNVVEIRQFSLIRIQRMYRDYFWWNSNLVLH